MQCIKIDVQIFVLATVSYSYHWSLLQIHGNWHEEAERVFFEPEQPLESLDPVLLGVPDTGEAEAVEVSCD